MAATLTLDAFTADLVADSNLVIYASPPFRPGKQVIGKSEFRKIFTMAEGTILPLNLLTVYTAKYGRLLSGSQIHFRFVTINAEGIAGQAFDKILTIT